MFECYSSERKVIHGELKTIVSVISLKEKSGRTCGKVILPEHMLDKDDSFKTPCIMLYLGKLTLKMPSGVIT